MAEIRTKSEEREYLSRLIADWNASRLDIFAISEPNEDLEYRGVMRFFFQDSGSKVATKCVRFTNRDNTEEVTKILVDKFHPDMKMLSNPTYSLYEVHPNGDARKLRMDEHPLKIQLEWQLDDREGRFLLKSDSDKIVHSNLFDVKSSDKTVPQGSSVGQNLKRRLSKREKKQLKKQKEEAKKAAEKAGKDDNQIAQHLYDELPETSFTRSISNPEAVMRRRRQQKLEKRLKDFQSKDSPAGGTLKIFATTLKPEIPYKTLLVSVDDTTTHVIKEALIKYQMEKEDPEEYCLVMVNIPVEGTNTSATLGKERVVHDDDCPLKIAVTWPSNRGTVVFHLRRRANLPQHRRDKRRSKSPVRKPMDLTPDKTVAERLAKPTFPDHLLPYLLELSSDGNDVDYKPRMHRLQMNATDVGSEKTFASGGNYLQLHAPHILPRHCVITNMDGRVSVTPSSGDAEVLVNGKRIYETTQLQHGDVMKIGRLHTFRFCDPAYEKPQRHSAPAAGDTGSISSNSDIDVQRKQRPQSLGSALPSHYGNSYPSNNIDDHVDVDTNEHPEGMFETTFDVSGEVLTYTGGHRETEPYTYSRPPASPTKTSFSNDDMYDDKLPATLEFRENGEDAFFAAVISEVNGLAVQFKLAPTYTLYMCSRYRLSPHYRSDLMEHQRGERLGVTILKIANMARSTIRENAEQPGSLAFWMANCSEFLHFIKEDVDISPYTKDGQQVLAQSVQLAFRHLVLCVQHELRSSMSAFLDPTDDADMEESDLDSMNDSDNDHMGMPSDGRSFRVQNRYGQDGRPLSGADSWFGGRRMHSRATVSEVIYNLTSTMSLLRRCRVNAALTIQVFSQLFHFINMWLFNKLVLEPKLDLCTREWGRRISKRLARVEKWAEKQGLELAADCHLCRIAQAAHLLQAPKNSSADINAISSSCFKLNSLQMRTLLENYRPAADEYMSQDHIERLVATAEEKADEVARSNGQEIQREEDTELQLPFLLPEDGYSCDVIRGVPPGLQGFLEPLANTGLCRLTIQPETSGLWTVYQRKHVEASVDAPSTITPEVQEVSFNKGRGGMGLSIVAAKGIRQDKLGIYIKQVVKDGPASKDGRLQAGDQILSVNGESLVGVTQEKAAEVMVKSGSIVTLKIVKQGAIYHGLATMLIQQSPNRETAPPPRKLTPVEPEPEPMQMSPTLPENDIRSPGRWLPDSYEATRRDGEESWRQKEDEIRRAKEEQERMFEERMRREDEERRREEEDRRREEEERRRREEEEEDRIRQEEEDRIREEQEERIRLEEEERIRREEEDRLYEERLRKEEEEKRLYEERRRKEEEEKRTLRLRQEKQEEERRKREEEEDEKFRIQEERIRKRMEEERRIIEEERRKLAEERRLLEEERKKEAERKRTEEQRLIEEERRLAEEKQRIEEERRRVMNQKKAEEETQRLEDERMALMAQRRRVEEEREIAEQQRREEMEEQRRREEMEEMRRREEIRKREEYRRMEDKRRLAEERKRSEEEERLRPIENKQRTRRIRFEDEVMAENAPKVETVQQRSSPQPVQTKPEKETVRPSLKTSVEVEKAEITPVNKKPNDEYYEEEPVVLRGRLSEEDISTMDALFEKLDEQDHQTRPNSLNISKQAPAEEPPTSPIRVDSRNTRYGRAIVIKQGMLPSARSPSSQNKNTFDYESVAQNLKAIDQSRRQKQDVNNDDEFERWQKRQREIAEQREREAEERSRLTREQEDMRQHEQREREQREREQREREQREREQREREQREREQREREQREREQREREQREREQREREQREREQREREQREREQREREQREREQREQRERQQRERQEQEQREHDELERQRLERERLERERKEYLEQQRKEQEEKQKAEAENKKKQEAEERKRVIERERKMLSSTSAGSKETLDYIEAMDEEEVEREFQRRLEAEKKRSNLDRSYEDRRAGGLVSVTRVTYHPDRDDQSERDRKLQMIIQERKELEREKKESDRRVVFEGEREKQKELQRRQQEVNERQQEDWLRQQREKHEQARREQGRFRMDKKSQEDEDIMKKRSELQQRREQEDVIRMNLQRVREEAERKMNEEHKQQQLEQERELERKLEEQRILIEKESEARRQLQEEQRMRSARGSTGEPDHVIELKERALKDYERRRMLIDQEINRQRAEGRAQEQLRQTAMEEVKTKFDQQPKPVSVLKTSNGTKPKKQVSFSNMSTEFHEPASPTYVVESSSGYTAKITPAASVRLVQTRPPADLDSPPIPRPPPPDDDDYDDYDPPPLPPPPPPEELLDDDQFPPLPRALYNDRSSSSSSMTSSDPRSPTDPNSRDYSDVFPADYPYPPNSHQFKNTVSNYGTYPRAARPVSYPTPADLDNLQFNDSVRYGGSNNNISGFNSSGIRETQSLGRITNADASAVEANRVRMGRISLTDDTRKEPPPVAKKPEKLGFKEKMKMFNQDGTPKSRVTVSRWEREQMDVNGEVSYT